MPEITIKLTKDGAFRTVRATWTDPEDGEDRVVTVGSWTIGGAFRALVQILVRAGIA